MTSLISGNIWKIISSQEERKGFAVIETEKLPMHADESENPKFSEIHFLKDYVVKESRLTEQHGITNLKKAFVVPICILNELWEIRIVYPYNSEELSNEQLIEKNRIIPERNFLLNKFSDLVETEFKEFNTTTGNISVFDYEALSKTVDYQKGKKIYGHEIKEILHTDSQQIGKILNGEEIKTEIVPYGFSISWLTGKYYIKEYQIKNSDTGESLEYGFSIQPAEYAEMYKSKHENKILTIDNIILWESSSYYEAD